MYRSSSGIVNDGRTRGKKWDRDDRDSDSGNENRIMGMGMGMDSSSLPSVPQEWLRYNIIQYNKHNTIQYNTEY